MKLKNCFLIFFFSASSLIAKEVEIRAKSKSQKFSFNYFLDSPKRVFSSFGLSWEFSFIFFLFQPWKTTFRPTMSKFWKNRIQFVMFSLKIPTVKSWFPDFQSSSPVVINAKSYSVFLLKSARNCPPSKSWNRSEVSRYSFVWLCRKSGQFVKDFSTKKVSLFPFFAAAPNDRG